MKFNKVLSETLWVKGGGGFTIHHPERNNYAHSDLHTKAYKKAIKNNTAYGIWHNHTVTRI